MMKYIAGALVMLLVVVGCNSDDPSAPLTPGSLDDPEFQIFMEEFGDLDETSGDMIDITLSVMDGVFGAQKSGVTYVAGEFNVSLIYDETTSSWVGTFEAVDQEEGVSISAISTVQFWHAGGPVQYPDPELLTEVRSEQTMDLTGSGLTLAATQDAILTPSSPGSNIIVINGNGRIIAGFEGEHSDEGGTTACTVDRDFTMHARNITVDRLADGCPISGTLEYSGDLSVACTGANEVSHNRRWSVVHTFNGETVTTQAISGQNIWTIEDTCL